MSKSNLTSQQLEYLHRLWDNGMTTVTRNDLIDNAIANTGLDKKAIRNWIGNEKKRQGMAVERGPREHKPGKYLPGKIRKRTAYSAFKSEFLAGDAAKQLKADGASSGEVLKQGSVLYRQLSPGTKEKYAQCAADTNADLPSSNQIPKETMIKRIIKNINVNMKQLDEFGCPSIWLGYGGKVPQRLYSPQMTELAEDGIFTNYVVSAMINKIAQSQMKEHLDVTGGVLKKTEKRRKAKRKESQTTSVAATVQNEDSTQMTSINQGDEVEILNSAGRKVGLGKVTGQEIVHGYKLKDGWIPLLVNDMIPNTKPWDDFPTQSGVVEISSFVAWPKAHLRLKGSSN